MLQRKKIKATYCYKGEDDGFRKGNSYPIEVTVGFFGRVRVEYRSGYQQMITTTRRYKNLTAFKKAWRYCYAG